MNLEFDHRFVFSPTYSAWNKLGVNYHTPLMNASPESSGWIRAVAPIANSAKKAIIGVAFVVCTIATAVFSLVILPYRIYQWNRSGFLDSDYNLLTPQEKKALYDRIKTYIDEREIKGVLKYSPTEKEEITKKIMSYYARSSHYYGPVAVAWTDYLLEKANTSKKKLIFMARDGIVPYRMAREMMKMEKFQKKFPNLVGDDQIKLAYLSRKVVKQAKESVENTAVFQKYIKQLGIVHGDQCIFVDIGFTGSMIDPIRKMLPGVDLEFEFLISHGEQANGFIYSHNDPRLEKSEFQQLPTIQSISYAGAGCNFATHWLEDSHQGVEESAASLVEVNGKIYPNTRIPGKEEYVSPPGSLDYLLRRWSQKSVIESYKKYPPENIDKKDVIKQFDELLTRIAHSELPLLIKHK